MKWLLQSLAAFLFLVLANLNPALAFQLRPISQVFAPMGREATRSYEVVNDSDERIAVEVSVVERTMDIDGQESYTPADDDFLIYPPQMIVEPRAVQTVRVTWLGDPDPAQELAYRLVAEQLPIKLVDPEAEVPQRAVGEVEILLRYMGSLFIRPTTVQANVQLVSAVGQTGSSGEPQLIVTLENQGTASARLREAQLSLTAQGTTVALQGDRLEGLNNAVVLVGNQRRFVLSWPEGLPRGEVAATFRYAQE